MAEFLPAEVKKVVIDLAQDPASESVWLIGSRAGSSPREDSDWDLLVFNPAERGTELAEVPQVDVVRVHGGEAKLDGKTECYASAFEKWSWKVLSRMKASYRGVATHGNELEVEDSDDDSAHFSQKLAPCKARLIWSREQGHVAT